jgi:hypothetical protein
MERPRRERGDRFATSTATSFRASSARGWSDDVSHDAGSWPGAQCPVMSPVRTISHTTSRC